MIRTPAVSLTHKLAVLVASVVCASMLSSGLATGAEAVVHYQKESMQAYEKQLSSGEIAAATFNKRVRSLHLTLKNGQHVLIVYPPHEQPKFATALEAKGIPVSVLKPDVAAKEAAAKPVHHKLRYIAGGILVLVIVVVGAVLLLDRRRKLAAE